MFGSTKVLFLLYRCDMWSILSVSQVNVMSLCEVIPHLTERSTRLSGRGREGCVARKTHKSQLSRDSLQVVWGINS